MRYIVFGDTGGHGQALLASLLRLGLDQTTMRLPQDITIIHLGDLIHKGPTSNQLIEVIDQIINTNPGRWIQLLGNHEFQHIPGAPYFWRCDCTIETVATIRSWHATGKARIAFGLDWDDTMTYPNVKKGKSILFTHSGITLPFWRELGSLTSASKTAAAINAAPIKVAARPGMMLENPHAINKNPGPVWALSTMEVFPGWKNHPMPFVQIHGHTTAYSWMQKRWWPTPAGFKESSTLDQASRAIITKVQDSLLIGLDPGFSQKVDLAEQPHFKIKAHR